MDTLAQLAQGFAVALTPVNLLWALVGVTLGTAVGVLPGVGPALTIALLLPLTYKVDATGVFILFAGIYYGAMYGGSTTSILLNTPGESATIVTALEGHKMARRGRARLPGPGRLLPWRPDDAGPPRPAPLGHGAAPENPRGSLHQATRGDRARRGQDTPAPRARSPAFRHRDDRQHGAGGRRPPADLQI